MKFWKILHRRQLCLLQLKNRVTESRPLWALCCQDLSSSNNEIKRGLWTRNIPQHLPATNFSQQSQMYLHCMLCILLLVTKMTQGTPHLFFS